MEMKPSLENIAAELQLMIGDALLRMGSSTFAFVLVNRCFYKLLNTQLYRYSIVHDNGKCLAHAVRASYPQGPSQLRVLTHE